jgi:hypothetical protein
VECQQAALECQQAALECQQAALECQQAAAEPHLDNFPLQLSFNVGAVQRLADKAVQPLVRQLTWLAPGEAALVKPVYQLQYRAVQPAQDVQQGPPAAS